MVVCLCMLQFYLCFLAFSVDAHLLSLVGYERKGFLRIDKRFCAVVSERYDYFSLVVDVSPVFSASDGSQSAGKWCYLLEVRRYDYVSVVVYGSLLSVAPQSIRRQVRVSTPGSVQVGAFVCVHEPQAWPRAGMVSPSSSVAPQVMQTRSPV